VQETYRIAFENWRTLREPAACRAWLLRILRNVHIDEVRRSRRLVALEGEVDLPDPRAPADPSARAIASLTLERLEALLARMPEEARWLFMLRELEGLSYAELAEVFEVPVGTIRSRLARMRARLVADVAGSARPHATKVSEKEHD
jgi:RNA polymerase sigma-70 factor (ECF subfamily)